MLRFEGVSAAYGSRAVLSDLSFDLLQGDRLGLVGPNGGGKTTVLRLMLGLLRPAHGRIARVQSELRFGYVPQREALDSVWPLVAEDVVAMAAGSRAARTSLRVRRSKARAALESLGEGALATVSYRSLSGGQKQRVLVARALVTDPDVLVLDEPTSGLDLPTASGLLGLVERLHREGGVTVVIASHDLNTVANHVDRVGLVVDGTVTIGSTAEMVTESRLSELYGLPVTVSRLDGQRVVLGRAEP